MDDGKFRIIYKKIVESRCLPADEAEKILRKIIKLLENG